MKYDIVYADPPWFYTPTITWNNTGAETHYPLMTDADILAFPMRDWMSPKAILFLWATCPRLDIAMKCIEAWGLYYRAVAFVWVKTRLDGVVMGAKGPPPSVVKPVTELVLAASTVKGIPFPVADRSVRQVIMAPRRRHSQKPDEVAERIVQVYGDRSRIEMFAREPREGWDRWGNEA